MSHSVIISRKKMRSPEVSCEHQGLLEGYLCQQSVCTLISFIRLKGGEKIRECPKCKLNWGGRKALGILVLLHSCALASGAIKK